MCGISGILRIDGEPVRREAVSAMGGAMPHRGPDNFSEAVAGGFGCAHNRLSIIDLSDAANQPFADERYTLVYNGEIYNFREIGRDLEQKHGVRLKTTSDTEVLFRSLIHHGVPECLSRIRGMFAFAFHDRETGELWLARDRLGIKPLYFYQKGPEFAFASEIKAIARAFEVELDPIRTLFSVAGMAERSREFTVFKGVTPVKPGTFVKISPGAAEPETHTFFDPESEFSREYYDELAGRSRKEISEEFERLFVKSIESMLISDAPVGAFVSGGIDSSFIAAVARKYYPDLKLFSANVVGPNSEIEDARLLADHIGSELFEARFEPEMLLTDWAEVTYYYESPIVVHANAIPFARVAKLARQQKIKAVLTGEGADELFVGYPRLLTRRYEGMARFPAELVQKLYGLVPGLREFLFPTGGMTATEFVKQAVQGFEAKRSAVNGSGRLASLAGKARDEQALTLNMLTDHLVTLLHRNDRMGMLASIEARFPFLDEDLVRFAINLPSKFKIGRTSRFHNFKHPFLIDKWVVRETAERFLPRRTVRKKKKGFPMTGLKSVRFDRGFFEGGWVKEALSMTAETTDYLLETQDPYFVGKLASVEIFGRIYGGGEAHSQVAEHIARHARMGEASGV